MCGIGGIVGFERSEIESKKSTLLSIQKHRGPDASSLWEDRSVILFHNRLSIIDLSEQANQPFISNCGNYTIVYNGEIYNYQEIRKKLANDGVRLKTNSDTEVILESFILYGKKCVEMFNGMFAFAICNKNTSEMFVYRDRIGIKPLFYFIKGKKFAFSSELKFLKYLLKDQLSLNYNGIGKYLHVGYFSAPDTVFNEVKILEPGQFLYFHDGNCKKEYFWSVSDNISKTVSSNWKENQSQLEELLITSVKNHLVADVPVGIFLSGGIDSSLITAIASKVHSSPLKTFSVGTNDKGFNETPYASQIAKHLKTDHCELIVTASESIKTINTALSLYDQPFADSSAIPTLLVSQMASQHVKVCLSGEGADELFGGYGSYKWADRLNYSLVFHWRKMMAAVFKSMGSLRAQKAARMLHFKSDEFLPSHIFSCEQNLFSRSEVANLVNFDPWIFNEMEKMKMVSKSRSLTPMEKQSFYDVVSYLPDDLLVKVDRASMFHSLEVRVPYLDHNLVRFALNIPASHKINRHGQKDILKRVLYKYLPYEMFQRPKQGFSVPVASWLKNELHYLIDENLNDEVIKKHDVIHNIESVHHLLSQFKAGNDYLYNRIWALIVLHKWLNTNQA